jgi:hypothetical protein
MKDRSELQDFRDEIAIRRVPNGLRRDREIEIRRTAKSFGITIALARLWERDARNKETEAPCQKK